MIRASGLVGMAVLFAVWIYASIGAAKVSNRKSRMRSVLSGLLTQPLIGDTESVAGSLLSWRAMWIWTNAPMPPPDWNQAWNDARNRHWSESSPQWLCDPGNPHARIVAIRGKDTVFDQRVGELVEMPASEADAIILVELLSDVFIWTQPGDVAVGDVDSIPGRADLPASALTKQARDYFVGFADGTAWLISRDTPLEVLQRFLTLSEAARNERDVQLAPYRIK